MNSNNWRFKHKKNNKGHPFFTKFFLAMASITLLQLFVFLTVLMFGGEFSYIRKYAYNNFIEKNINRKSDIENLLTLKTAAVNSASTETAALIDEILSQHGLGSDALKSDKKIDNEIISDSTEILLSLIRQNMVNDVYMFIDSGNLFDNGNEKKLAGIYIRDIDPGENDISNNEDLLMEIGSSDIASSLGISLDFEWAGQLDASDNSDGSLDFYYKTIETAVNHKKPTVYELGYWSGFTRISRSATKSMKYTVPLISKNGDIYGVLGIGITDKLIQDLIPANDSFSNTVCYILGADFENKGEYVEQTHLGNFFARIENNNLKINKEHRIEGDIYDFTYGGKLKTLGNIQSLKLYNSASPYKNQKWALISIGNEEVVMAIYDELIKMFLISSVVSIVICLIGSLILNAKLTSPVSKMIKTLDKSSARSGEIVKFAPSNIREIDMLGDAITRLQIDVRENASRVSKVISMVDMGIGVLMYDRKTKQIYISESLIKLLKLQNMPTDKDVTISFEEFEYYLSFIDKDNVVCSNNIFYTEKTSKADIIIMYNSESGAEIWLKFSLVTDKSNVIGLVQDITSSVQEKRRIEFERDYDITTGLLNRRAYLSKLDALFSVPEQLKTAAIIMTDLDNLKYVNDTYGHDFGDDYIRTAANVLNEFTNYNGIVSRLSGDEFNVFIYGYDSKDEIRKVVETVRAKLAESYCMLSDGTKYKIKSSAGIAWFPENSQSYEMLMKYADFAMYTIKHTTKGSIAEFSEKEYQKDSILITGVEEMNRIIDEESVMFAFQTIVSSKDGSIFGYEVLMRPKSEILKAPIDFIRIAKSSSKLYEIERLTWLNGLKSFDKQIKKGNISPDARIFLNSLSSCIINKDNVEHIERNYPHLLHNLMLEILEGETENENYTEQKLEMLKRWNAKIALDDFGTGYNSEYLFLKLNPDLIKIDRSIISGCDKDKNKIGIINSLVKMAKRNDSLVLAEGVETSGELKCVIYCGVDLIQGYYVTYPKIDPEPIRQDIVDEICSINNKMINNKNSGHA